MARSAILNVMVQAAVKAGRARARDLGEVAHLQVSRKGPGDFVSAADRRAEDIIHNELARARPGYGFLMEESGAIEGSDGQHRWIVDPLDGTTNFLHGIPLFCTSIGLERQGVLIAGVILNPIADELFVAERGRGAFLNDRRLRVAARRDIADALIATEFPHVGGGGGDDARALAELREVMPQVSGIRANGSAALTAAWTAAGRYDGWFQYGLSPWDLAAGVVILREAGALVSDATGGERFLDSGAIVVGNEPIHQRLLTVIGNARRASATNDVN
jgi:myo-inositol-1(or 4)-monophosphatase